MKRKVGLILAIAFCAMAVLLWPNGPPVSNSNQFDEVKATATITTTPMLAIAHMDIGATLAPNHTFTAIMAFDDGTGARLASRLVTALPKHDIASSEVTVTLLAQVGHESGAPSEMQFALNQGQPKLHLRAASQNYVKLQTGHEDGAPTEGLTVENPNVYTGAYVLLI